MFFSLDVLPARKGDCLMLHYGDKAKPRVILIDGGPSQVYKPFLQPRIELLKKARGLDKSKPLPIDLLMVSHVDDDHIKGILDLTKDLRAATTPQVKIKRLWHNSFENIIKSSTKPLTDAFKKSSPGQASVGGELPEDVTLDADTDLGEEQVVWNLKVLASIPQGAQLRRDAEVLGIDLNPEFGRELIQADAKADAVTLDNLTFTVVGPMEEELLKLEKDHQKWLKKLKKEGKTPDKVLADYVDESVPNLSSIVVLVEAGTGKAKKRILFTGDARGDKILKGLELTGQLQKKKTMKVDVLKVPHHGSDNNLDDDFFERIIAKHYVFSGNGEHGNPERKSLQMLLDARGDEDYEVHLTYPIDEIDPAREEAWNKEQKKKPKAARTAWSKKKHGLEAFFDDNPKFFKKFRFVDKKKPHLIDLLDKVAL